MSALNFRCVLRKQALLDEAITLLQEGLGRAQAVGEKDWIHKYKKLIGSLKDEQIVLKKGSIFWFLKYAYAG